MAPLNFHQPINQRKQPQQNTVEQLSHFPALSYLHHSCFPSFLSVAVDGQAAGAMIKHGTGDPWRQEPCPNLELPLSDHSRVGQKGQGAPWAQFGGSHFSSRASRNLQRSVGQNSKNQAVCPTYKKLGISRNLSKTDS